MGVMPKKKTLTVQRVLALVIAYITLCVGGGVVTSIFFMPAVFAANNAAKAVIPSLAVEGIDFDVTSLPQRSTMYFNDGKTTARRQLDTLLDGLSEKEIKIITATVQAMLDARAEDEE